LQVLDRGEKIELLVDKTENLRSQVCFLNGSKSIDPHRDMQEFAAFSY